MIRLGRLRAAAVMVALLSVVSASPRPSLASLVDAAQECTPDIPALERWLRVQADSAGFSGVVLIERGGRVVLNRSYGSVNRESAFWLGATTKPFTAAAILRLVDEGKLAVSDSLYHFFRSVPRQARAITIDQLLTHMSGIAASGAAVDIGDRESAVRAILSEPLEHRPGRTYHYQDEDYNILAAIVETVAGIPFEAFVERHLLIPAGLSRSGFCGRLPPNVKLAPSADPGVAVPCAPGVTPMDWADRGVTGLVSTAADLLKWIRALKGSRVLSQSSREALERGQVFVRRDDDSDIYSGYGARVYMQGQQQREVWQSGYDVRVGHSSAVRLLENGTVIIVLSNAGLSERGEPWATLIARGIVRCRPRS